MEYQRDTSELLDSLVCAILVTDEQLKLCYINQSAEELLSNSSSQILHKKITDVISSPAFEAQVNQAIKQRQRHISREYTITIAGNGSIIVDSAISPIIQKNKVIGVSVELSKIDRQIRIARETQLIDTQLTNQIVLQGIAHEIKNPLGGVRGAAQLIELEYQEDQELKEYTGIIISEVDRLTKLVNDMLGPVRQAKKEQVNIHEILEHAHQLSKIKLPESITIETDYDPSIPEFEGDRDQLLQVVLNIMNNAIKAVGKEGHIHLKTRVAHGFTLHKQKYPLVLRIDIIDTGSGIPKELQNKIFFPMITGHAEGTGLGLSIAQSLIQRHKGLIEFDTKQGKTRFSIILPINTKT